MVFGSNSTFGRSVSTIGSVPFAFGRVSPSFFDWVLDWVLD